MRSWGIMVAGAIAVMIPSPSVAQPAELSSDEIPEADRELALLRAEAVHEEAKVLFGKGEFEEASRLLGQVIQMRAKYAGIRDPETLSAGHDYAEALHALGQDEKAQSLLGQILELRREILGTRHADTLATLSLRIAVLKDMDWYYSLEPLLAEQLSIRRETLGSSHPDTLTTLHEYARVVERSGFGRFVDAKPLYYEAARLRRETLGKKHPDSIASLHGYARVLEVLQPDKETESVIFGALLLSREVFGDRDPRTLSLLDSHGSVLRSIGRNEDSARVYAEAFRLRRKELGKTHPDTLEALQSYTDALRIVGRADDAEPLLAEAMKLSRLDFGDRDAKTLSILDRYGSLLRNLGRNQEAGSLYAESFRLREQELGLSHLDTLKALSRYASILLRLGRVQEIESKYAELLRLQLSGTVERDPDVLSSIEVYAQLLLESGYPERGVPFSEGTLDIRREVQGYHHPMTQRSTMLYARLLIATDRAAEAEVLVRNVLDDHRFSYNEDPDFPYLDESLTVYARVAMALGRTAEAATLYAEALQMNRKLYAGHPMGRPDIAANLSNYAASLQHLGRNEEAEPLLLEALTLSRDHYTDRHPTTISMIWRYAELLQNMGRSADAKRLYVEALQLSREVSGNHHPTTLSILNDVTRFLLDSNDQMGALNRARELASAIRERASTLVQLNLRGGAQRERELADRQASEKLLADALWRNVDASSASGTAIQEEAFSALQLASSGTTSKAVAQAATLRFASNVGLDSLVKERQSLTRDWAELERELLGYQKGLDSEEDNNWIDNGGVSVSERRSDLREQLLEIEQRTNAIDGQLKEQLPQYFTILNEQAINLEALREVLTDDEAVLLLVPTDLGLHAMSVSNENIEWSRAKLAADALAEKVNSFRKGLEILPGGGLPMFDFDLAFELYSELIAPVEKTLVGKKRVYVISDGALSRIPLGALITSRIDTSSPAISTEEDRYLGDALRVTTLGSTTNTPGQTAALEDLRSAQWLADRYALVTLPSLQSLVFIRTFGLDDKEFAGPGYTGFGDPVLAGHSSLRGIEAAALVAKDAAALLDTSRSVSGEALMDAAALRDLNSLPGTRIELEQVRRLLGAADTSLFLGEEMTEPAIRNADLSQTRILHLATHGLTSEEGGRLGELAEPGLVFTPPEKSSENNDGYLAASEVVGLDLTLAEWVILSACNTAAPSGKAGETGLSGLAQAFFYAGAESLLVSHWPVLDRLAPILTAETLGRSEAGVSRAEALQAAMQEVRKTDPHPAAWAPFVLVGEGR